MNKLTQRDAFWNKIYECASQDSNIIVISADMGAPALDKFRKDLPAQFINVGIAEQNAVLIASGLALEGKHPFVYAIAPFVTLRCLEQIRVENSIMNISVTLVGVGAGFGYDDSGPTHHLIEDIAIMRAMPNISIHSITDNIMAEAFAEISCSMNNANYVRLDRKPLPDLYQPDADFSQGFAVLKKGKDGLLIATGCMAHTAMHIADDLMKDGIALGVIDVYCIPTKEEELIKAVAGSNNVFTLEEHFLPGGFGSYILEILSDHGLLLTVKRFGLSFDNGYCYVYGGRPYIHEYYGIDSKHIKDMIQNAIGT